MHALIELYSRAYLTAAHVEVPPEWHRYSENASGLDPAPSPPGSKPGLFACLAQWLRSEWDLIREEHRKSQADRIYWPPDL